MTERISLAEAYNNKDVVTQIAILKDKLDSIPDADLTNVVLKTGDQIIDGEKTFNDPIVANGGVVFANSGIHVNGTLEVDGDIIQNGSAYETHAEQVFTKNDLIVTREDAIGGIAAGQLSGIRVKKYDGVSDLNLGVDSGGIMRVGDLGQEQPLATREEAANMTSGALVKWDGVNNRMIAPASNVGDDTHPVKIVNGEAVQVTDSLQIELVQLNDVFSLNLASNTAVFNLGSITASKTGSMILSISGSFGNNSQGYRLIGFSRNSTTGQEAWILNSNANSDAFYFSVTAIVPVTAGDVIRACAYQTSGSTLGISGGIRAILI